MSNPFADRIAQVAADVAHTPRRDGLDRIITEAGTARQHAAHANTTAPAAPLVGLISERQHSYASDLLDQRDVEAETRPAWRARLEVLRAGLYDNGGAELWTLDRDQASALIDCLKALPVRDRELSDEQRTIDTQSATCIDEVPAGRYAVEHNDVLWFVKVDVPTEGKWAGFRFVTRQLSDDYERLNKATQRAILADIAAVGPRECAIRYGHELGHCAVCGRTLTNEDSRNAGIGPKCASASGW